MAVPSPQSLLPGTLLPERSVAQLPDGEPPTLVTVVSTEEEFDWTQPFHSGATGVRHARALPRLQEVFDRFGVRPTYLVTHPMASQEEAVGPLGEIHADGRCDIGLHLHPWVTPPIEEEINDWHSFPCNLPGDLEERKIRALADQIELTFGSRPVSYQAGRYGIGLRTPDILRTAGLQVDFSLTPPYDFRPEGGPDFSAFGPEPLWADPDRQLLMMPITGAYVGFAGRSSGALYRAASALWARAPGLLARLRAVDRLRLSPEGFDVGDNVRLARHLIDRGVRTFAFNFHSPSVMAGCTPYVQTENDVRRFLDRCNGFYDSFLGELGGRTMTPLELKNALAERAADGRT